MGGQGRHMAAKHVHGSSLCWSFWKVVQLGVAGLQEGQPGYQVQVQSFWRRAAGKELDGSGCVTAEPG